MSPRFVVYYKDEIIEGEEIPPVENCNLTLETFEIPAFCVYYDIQFCLELRHFSQQSRSKMPLQYFVPCGNILPETIIETLVLITKVVDSNSHRYGALGHMGQCLLRLRHSDSKSILVLKYYLKVLFLSNFEHFDFCPKEDMATFAGIKKSKKYIFQNHIDVLTTLCQV